MKSDKERFLTTQHERDAETGLDYRGARYYDSDIARFLSLDPHAANYPSLSDYSYVAGNPIAYIDPDGRDVKDVIKTVKKGLRKLGNSFRNAARLIRDSFAERNQEMSPEMDEAINYIADLELNEISVSINGSKNTASSKGNSSITDSDKQGMYIEFNYGLIFGGGMDFAHGYVFDKHGARSYTKVGGGIGFDLGPGFDVGAIKAVDDETFSAEDFEGPGHTFNVGIGVMDASISGNGKPGNGKMFEGDTYNAYGGVGSLVKTNFKYLILESIDYRVGVSYTWNKTWVH